VLVRRLTAAASVAVAALGVLTTSGAATAAGSKCVALVVDFSHVGGSVSSACVTVPTSASGSDVLVAGHHKVTFDPRYGNDFVCAIDGVPAGGCHATDDTHYWVYYHRAPGGSAWHVSQEGAGTYKPANASTDGWVYDDGASSAPTPRDVPYASICTKPSPSPTPARTASPTSAPVSSASAAHPLARRSTTAATAPPQRVVAASASPVTTLSASAPAPSVSASSVAARATHGHRMLRVPLGLVIALIAAAALGAAAVVRLRRSSG